MGGTEGQAQVFLYILYHTIGLSTVQSSFARECRLYLNHEEYGDPLVVGVVQVSAVMGFPRTRTLQ